MQDARPILYGVSDYAEIRKADAWFVDRTAKIRELEKVPYAVFLRPRRFGKSLLCAILEAYYDIDCADRFDELFSGTDIGANPTGNRNKYLVMRFDFSSVDKDAGRVQSDFDYKVSIQCDFFARKYKARLRDGVSERILAAPDGGKKLSEIMSGLKESGRELYIIVDEYDNFTNTILAESGIGAYNDLCHGDGFFKQFFTELKSLTTSLDAPLKRLFVTGVSPVTMDDVTSGFNIGTNISLDPVFADLTGFRHDDLRAIADYYAPLCGFDAGRAGQVCLDWFDNYRFGSFDATPVANTTLVLNFFDKLVRAKVWPDDYIDENLRTDYSKIKHLILSEQKLNGNFHALETLVSDGMLSERLAKSFQAKDIAVRENFVSLLYWLGFTTITGDDLGQPVFGVPNGVMRQIAAQTFTQTYADACGIDQRLPAVNAGMRRFAKTGEFDGILEPLLAVVKENFAIRDAKEGETAVASAVSAILISAGGPYVVTREREANGGFYDLAMSPRFDIAPQIAHAAVVELKYLKPGGRKPAKAALAAIKAEAVDQLDKYCADPALAKKWRLAASGGHVHLHRLVLVFKGGDCILAEEEFPVRNPFPRIHQSMADPVGQP